MRGEIILVSWRPPPRGIFKLNVDGRCISNTTAGCGGILRDARGEWIRGFSKQLTEKCPVATEYSAVLEGIKFCLELGLNSFIVESDARLVVEAINNKQLIQSCHHLYREMQAVLQQDGNVVVTHIFREANNCADVMAAISIKQTRDYMTWIGPPLALGRLLVDDRDGKQYPRRLIA